MAKKRKGLEGKAEQLEVDMTPLIDVTFLLIIFFMIISTLNDMERAAVRELPVTRFQATIEPDVTVNRLIVNILEDGTISMYGREYDIDGFRQQLAQYRPTLVSIGRDTGEAPILLRGHRRSRYEIIRQILSAIYNERFERIIFVAHEQKDDNL